MENSGCKMKGCFMPMLVSTVLVALGMFIVEYVIHGIWLMPLYQQTASLWRPMSEMGMHPWCVVRLLLLAFLFSVLYCKCKKAKMEACGVDGTSCPIKGSLCFGIVIGLLIGTMSASTYLWMPIPGELAVKWFIGGIAEGIMISLVLGALCFKSKGE